MSNYGYLLPEQKKNILVVDFYPWLISDFSEVQL